MKILFAVPKVKSLTKRKSLTVHPHVGIAYLSSFLKSNKVDVMVFDDGVEGSRTRLFHTIREFKPDLIGVTVFGYSYGYARELLKALRQGCRIPLVLGGAHVSTIRAETLYDTDADFAIKHEGEYSLLELIKAIVNGNRDFSKVQGLIWRGDSGNIVENADRPLIRDLDSLPFPDYDIFDIGKYYCNKVNTLPIITSRGCPFGCNFCSVRLSMGQAFRARSAKNIIDELEYFVKKGWRNFDINDDCFTLDKRRVEEICDSIINKGLKIKFQFPNGIRVDTVTPQLLRKLKSAGCSFILYGCEAGNDRMLKLIKKGITLEQVKRAVEWTNAAGINNAVNFIIGHTQETYYDALDTIRFAKSLPTDFANFYNLIPYPGTEAFTWVKEHGNFLVPSRFYLENISSNHIEPIFETGEFTKGERRRIMKEGFNLYKRKYLRFRLGVIVGSGAYYLSRIWPLEKLAASFVLDSQFGKFIYNLFSGLFNNFRKSKGIHGTIQLRVNKQGK